AEGLLAALHDAKFKRWLLFSTWVFFRSLNSLKACLWSQSCFSDRKKASNLGAYVDWFNRLSYLVATEICVPVKKKQRARVMEFFIDVARECFNIGNFNSLMAIISGMNMSPVSRLRKTWSKVKTAKFDILEHQMDPSSNFYNYRTALRGAVQRSRTAHSTREKVRLRPQRGSCGPQLCFGLILRQVVTLIVFEAFFFFEYDSNLLLFQKQEMLLSNIRTRPLKPLESL
uniref:Ras-GEF domain-containing protein n=1 Tax=Oryzias sinensis TaxID=183150 RepID=A0A8C7YF17_9TELE